MTDKKEKTYSFVEFTPDMVYQEKSGGVGGSFGAVEVKESELTAAHKDYLLGKAINEFSHLTEELKHKFIAEMLEATLKSDSEHKINLADKLSEFMATKP